jgi:DNA-binding NtrC family response regulator
MSPGKALICHRGNQEVADQLAAILKSNLILDVQILGRNQSNSHLSFTESFDILFIIFDSGGINEKLTKFKIPANARIAVICSGEVNNDDIEFLTERFDDYLFAPLNESEVICRTKRLIGSVSDGETEATKKNLLQKLGMSQIIGQDPSFLEIISKIQIIADSDVTILITGETGVGKEVCARAIHYLSGRSDKPFIPVNCGAIPASLMENELFGHMKGAYTDARNNQLGVVAEAEGGTLFLDEIDALSPEAQSKLLRLLQDKTYRPLGHNKTKQADIRMVVASNVDLKKKIEENEFRQDLFYRFSVPLHLPPLRERKEDIPLLSDHFIKKYGQENDISSKSLSKSAAQKMLLYEWPGNIRELENIIQQAILLTRSPVIPPDNIYLPISIDDNTSPVKSFAEEKKKVIEAFEKNYITQLLIEYDGNISLAARKANKDRSDFSKMVKKYNLSSVYDPITSK